jgi:hypothetical protein
VRSYKAKMLGNDPLVSSEYLLNKENRFRVELRNGNKMQRSRYIMAKFLCAKDLYIPVCLAVHHKNGDTTDDRLENLELMKHSEHTRKHAYARPHKYGVSPTLDPVEYQRRSYLANKEKRNAQSRSWKLRHPEETKRVSSEWKKNHREEVRAYKREYYHRKKNEGVMNA